jgi:membrane protease YdiL (CAAX protease family)
MNIDAVVRRAMLAARALGLVLVIYFLPVLLRDLGGSALPGGGILSLLRGSSPAPAFPMLLSLATVALSIGIVLLYSRTGPDATDPRPLLRLDASSARRWLLGFAGGLAIVAAAHIPLFSSGIVRVQGLSSTMAEQPFTAVAIFAVLLAESLREELAFRGPPQRDLSRAGAFPLAAVFLSATFTILHLANPNAEPLGLLGVFLAGLALAGVVRREGDLALAAGLHAGWNVMLGMILSAPVSGITLGARLLESETHGTEVWTGGPFGFESSLPGVLTLFTAGYFAWRSRSRSPRPAESETKGTSVIE